MKVPDRLRVVGAETEVEVCAGGEDEEELWPAGVELAEGVISVQQLGGEVLQEPVRHRGHQAVGRHTLVHGAGVGKVVHQGGLVVLGPHGLCHHLVEVHGQDVDILGQVEGVPGVLVQLLQLHVLLQHSH